MQTYTALRRRTTLGVKLHVLSNGTGDAGELVARLGPNGRFEIGYTLIAELAAEVTQLKESHHFYPIIFYFRFREPFYSVSNVAQLALEAAALIKTAMNDDEYSWLKQSAAVSKLGSSAKSLVQLLDQAFLLGGAPGADQFSEDDLKSWRARIIQAIAVTRAAGIKTTRNE